MEEPRRIKILQRHNVYFEPRRIRTFDPQIKSLLLYQLS